MASYNFTTDWFSINIDNWTRWLGHLKGKPVNMLEIGSFQGRSAIWSLENILTHDDSKIYCCDTFEGGVEHTEEHTNQMFDIFKNNVSRFGDKVVVLKGKSGDCLKANNFGIDKKEFFDVIYIDGDHRSHGALEDAILAFPLLKKDGIMIFDDYMGGDIHSIQCCKIGIDAFMICYQPYVDVVQIGYQLCIKKRV